MAPAHAAAAAAVARRGLLAALVAHDAGGGSRLRPLAVWLVAALAARAVAE